MFWYSSSQRICTAICCLLSSHSVCRCDRNGGTSWTAVVASFSSARTRLFLGNSSSLANCHWLAVRDTAKGFLLAASTSIFFHRKVRKYHGRLRCTGLSLGHSTMMMILLFLGCTVTSLPVEVMLVRIPSRLFCPRPLSCCMPAQGLRRLTRVSSFAGTSLRSVRRVR